MPSRFNWWVALLLAITICVVLVLPQVDLDDGVLKDGQSQIALVMLWIAVAALVLFFPPDPLRNLRTFLVDLDPRGIDFFDATPILRC